MPFRSEVKKPLVVSRWDGVFFFVNVLVMLISPSISARRRRGIIFGVDIKGSMAAADSSRIFSSSARVHLTGLPPSGDKRVVHFHVGDARITSDCFSDQARENFAVSLKE